MDVLVRKSNSTVTKTWPDGVTDRVDHPDKPNGALSTYVGSARPLDLGDFVLVQATVENESYDLEMQTRTGPDYTVSSDYSTTATYTVAYKSLADCKAVKLAQLAAYRYEQETGGVTVNGVTYPTDRQSRKDLRDARDSLSESLVDYVDFKGPDGFFRVTSASQVTPMLAAIAVHVRDVFSNEDVHTDAINALSTAAAVASYDITTGW